ncbi:MAG TPA: 4Fe-4S binding protein [Stellaceae bacterium]|nr:4Fe-4S binding protein [Stellaceae bacterium]
MTRQTLADSPASVPPFHRDGLWPAAAARIESFAVRHRRKLVFVHAAMFGLFAALMIGPLLLPPAPSGVFASLAGFATFIVWGVWFPLVFLSVIVSGRSWCGLLCPMGAASEWANRIGLNRPIPHWVQWPGTPVVSFVVVTIWAQTAGARDHAEAMAIVFGSTLAAALLLGFLFGRRKRAWCRHMCPIGLLLGVYSRIGIVDFHPKRPRPGGDHWTERTACPTLIDLDRKTESRHCIACHGCVSPAAKGGLYFRLRRLGAEVAAIRDHNPNLAEVLFLFVGTGVSLGGFLWLVLPSYQSLRLALGNWAIGHGWDWFGMPGPVWLMANYPAEREVFRWLDFLLIAGYMLAWTIGMTALLGAATAGSAWLSGRLGGDRDFRRRFVELGYQFLPIAMVSLLLGLGGNLFSTLAALGLGAGATAAAKAGLFAAGGLWSLVLGERLLARQGVGAGRRWLALLPGLLGSLAIGAAWYPAVFLS